MIRRFTLAVALVLRRLTAAELAAGAMLAAAVIVGAFVVPGRARALDEALSQKESLSRRANAAKAITTGPHDHLGAFRQALGARQESERHIETVLALARESRLTVRKAEYRSAYDKAGDYHTLQVTLPFQSGYGPVRAFCDEVLRALPFASIDAVLFSRNAVGVADLDAKIVVTFFLTDADLSASAAASAKRSDRAIPRQAVIP